MGTDDKLAADFAALGVAAAVTPQEPDDGFPVLAENFEAVRAFDGLQTQWRFVAAGGRLIATGLDYAAAAAVHKGRNERKWCALIDALRIMEKAALPLMNEGSD